MNSRGTFGDVILIEHLPYTPDPSPARRGRIGLVMLASDHTIEAELHWLIGQVDGLALFSNRIENVDQVTPDTLRAMAPRITAAADLILAGADLDVVAYGCTSASMAIGEEQVVARIQHSRPAVRCTTPITGAFAAFEALGAKRIAVLTPYRADVNRIVADYITARGYEVPVFGSFNEESDAAVGTISVDSVRDGIRAVLAESTADAVFVSCTSVRVAHAVAELEAEFGLPITSSNHAMAWHAIRLAGVPDPLPHLGTLYAQ